MERNAREDHEARQADLDVSYKNQTPSDANYDLKLIASENARM